MLNGPSGRYSGAAIALNAEKIVDSYANPGRLDSVKPFSFFYADGISVVWLLRRYGVETSRVPGVELWEEVMKRVGELGLRLYLLGASEEVNSATAEKLAIQYGVTEIERHHGYFENEEQIISDIKTYRPDVVTVAMGSPRQEEFIASAYRAVPEALYMGVGGSYDVYTGRVKRAPWWLRNNGLEFLYRFVVNPRRARRYLRLFTFLYLYVSRKI